MSLSLNSVQRAAQGMLDHFVDAHLWHSFRIPVHEPFAAESESVIPRGKKIVLRELKVLGSFSNNAWVIYPCAYCGSEKNPGIAVSQNYGYEKAPGGGDTFTTPQMITYVTAAIESPARMPGEKASLKTKFENLQRRYGRLALNAA